MQLQIKVADRTSAAPESSTTTTSETGGGVCGCSVAAQVGNPRADADLIEARAIMEKLGELGIPSHSLSASFNGDTGRAEVRIFTRSGLIVLSVPAYADVFTLVWRRERTLPLVARRLRRAQPQRVAAAVFAALKSRTLL